MTAMGTALIRGVSVGGVRGVPEKISYETRHELQSIIYQRLSASFAAIFHIHMPPNSAADEYRLKKILGHTKKEKSETIEPFSKSKRA